MSSLSNDSRDDPCRQPKCTRHDGFWTLQNLFGTPSCGFRVRIAIPKMESHLLVLELLVCSQSYPDSADLAG